MAGDRDGLAVEPPRPQERDRVRDAIVQKAGLRVLRVTSQRLDDEPAAILADILALRS